MLCVLLTTIHMSTRPEGFLDLDKILLVGADVHVLVRTGRNISVTDIDDHELPALDTVTCVALIQNNQGKVNMLMHEYAYYGRGNSLSN